MDDHRVVIDGPYHQPDGPVWIARCSCGWWAVDVLRIIILHVEDHQNQEGR